MNGFLLDTNVVSEIRKGRRANSNLQQWLTSLTEASTFMSVLSLGEIRKGIEASRPRDPTQTRVLEQWLHGLENRFTDRLLPITGAICDQWGRISAIRPVSVVDGLLAATAMVHDLTLVTRNTADIAHTGVLFLDPF